MGIRRLNILLAGICLSTAMSAQAEPPHLPDLVKDGNRWTITAYDDDSTVHTQWATQGICFYYAGTQGTQQLYTWVSDTYPDWNGRAVQEGDQVFMHGDYAQDMGHDGMAWEVTTSSPKNEGYGHWKEWREDGGFGNTIGFANAKLQRVGTCKAKTVHAALEQAHYLALPHTDDGEQMMTPSGMTQRQLETLK